MIHPPSWATRILECYCRPELLEDLQGDLNEFFERNVLTKGLFLARLIYIIDVLKFFRVYTLRKPSLTSSVIKKVMIRSYIKSSRRVIIRSKLFSGINIVGLAVSMSVGMLIIAFVSDLYSYDLELKHKDRIYRITTVDRRGGQTFREMASTSWKAGNLVKEKIPGIEAVTIMRRSFRGDAKIGEFTVPVSGLYADNNFFDVFSFPLAKGISQTCLKEPYSIVLTETSAKKLFGNQDVIGKIIKFDSANYVVTGLMSDIPKRSHIKFEMLVSLSSINVNEKGFDGDVLDWTNIYSNYVYMLLDKKTDPRSVQSAVNKFENIENATLRDRQILLSLQSIKNIAVGVPKGNEIGPVVSRFVLICMAALAFVIILSACFNYTNLSIARSLRRSREVGIRKVVGAVRAQIMGQFIAESVIIALCALCFAFLIFLVLRVQFLSLHPEVEKIFSLELSPRLFLYFILLAVVVGMMAGLLPAVFYSKINAVRVLKDASTMKVFRHVSLRKALIVIQYTFSLIFITATIIGFSQYKGFLRFDLGFKTDHILNINMQNNKEEVFVKELSALPGIKGISKSLIVSSIGSIYGSIVKYNNPSDSSMVDINNIDEHYLPLHQYTLLSGRNFTAKPKNAPETEVVVNEELIRRFNIGHNDPEKAIGQVIHIDNKDLMIISVLKDFHYGTLDNRIDPAVFIYSADPNGYVNVKIETDNTKAMLTSIETIWKKMDPVHPLDAKFYDDQIENAYSQFSVMLKIIGFFAFLAISIASLGMFGMVIYTMEKRLKEVSIRKILGAGEGILMYMLSKSFLQLLLIAALIALPVTWLVCDKVLLRKFAYHQPIHIGELFIGLLIVAGMAAIMIGLQTLKIIRVNPARVLKNE